VATTGEDPVFRFSFQRLALKTFQVPGAIITTTSLSPGIANAVVIASGANAAAVRADTVFVDRRIKLADSIVIASLAIARTCRV
jgi:hypothetical protein